MLSRDIRQQECGQKQKQVGNSHSKVLAGCRKKPLNLSWAAAFLCLECLVLAEMMKINGNEGRPFSILFRGCSFLIVYEAGVLTALRELSPDILKSASRIYGASSGSVVATLALCECDIGKGYALPFFLCLKRFNVWKFWSCKRSFFFFFNYP